MKKLLVLLSLISIAHADEFNNRVTKAMNTLESAFVPVNTPYTMIEESNITSTFDTSISNKWQVSFKGNQAGTLNTIAIVIDDYNMTQDSSLPIQPNVTATYLFADKSLTQIMNSIGYGYKYLGAYKQINASQFIGFSDFKIKRMQLILTWIDNQKVYKQDVSYFLMVFAK